MQAFILFCGFLSVSLAFQCYSDGNPDGQAPTSAQTAIDCADGCNYCAKITGKLKGSKKTLSGWGCGCGGDDSDIATPAGHTCTKKETKSLKDDSVGKGKLYCCDADNVSLAFQCYVDENPNGEAPTSDQTAIDCADGCKYCAKITGKLKGSKDKGSLWGCGCGGEYDLPWVFGYKCTKKGTQSVKDDAGDKGKLYCCDKENVSLAFQCYIDLNRNGQAPTSAQAVIDCADGCKYCAKITGKFKDSKNTISVWGCGCGGDEKDIAGRDYMCTKEETKNVKNDAGDTGKLYCCDKEKCNSTNQLSLLFPISTLIAILLLFKF
ncbi:unnamed protein product, partial [Mesorhabditis belari]|uniref:Uncharacterized protein n=1 Tax=Mesorhabditis belari TaxID=2138241 RepID=A0AAF3FME1_9BILA